MSTPKPIIGHAAFHPYAGTPEPLRSAGNLPTNILASKSQRILELENECALLREAVDKAHAKLDECGLISPRPKSHDGLAERIQKLIKRAKKGTA